MIGGITYLTSPLSYVAALVGLVLLVTGFVSSCALYSAVGINTAGKDTSGKTVRMASRKVRK